MENNNDKPVDSEPVYKWVKASEELPDFSKLVLLWHKSQVTMLTGFLTNTGWVYNNCFLCTDSDLILDINPQDITHWMPLPKPPNKEINQPVEDKADAIRFVEWIADMEYSQGSDEQKGMWFDIEGEGVADSTKSLYNIFENAGNIIEQKELNDQALEHKVIEEVKEYIDDLDKHFAKKDNIEIIECPKCGKDFEFPMSVENDINEVAILNHIRQQLIDKDAKIASLEDKLQKAISILDQNIKYINSMELIGEKVDALKTCKEMKQYLQQL